MEVVVQALVVELEVVCPRDNGGDKVARTVPIRTGSPTACPELGKKKTTPRRQRTAILTNGTTKCVLEWFWKSGRNVRLRA